MKEDKAHILRKTVTIITIILIFATAGLLSITSQIKTITLDYFGNVQTIKTLSGSVDGFLLQNKISVGDNIQVYPATDAKIQNGMEIKISSKQELAKLDEKQILEEHKPVVARVEEVVENIPFAEETKENPTINRGATQVVQEGVEGKKATKFVVKYNEDKEIMRAQVSTEVVTPTVNKVVEVGTKLTPTASRSAVVNSVQAQVPAAGFKQYNIKLPVEQQQYAYNLCQRYGIQYELFLAVMYKESGFNPSAFGGGNSYGLCQIHISNHVNLRSKLGISDFFNPYDNMTAGAYLLSHYMSSQGGNVVNALNAYNGRVSGNSYGNSVLAIRNRLIANGGL